MIRLADLYVYPLKSGRGIHLDAAELDEFGLRYDRRWMVVDAAGDLVTQREEPRLALVRTAIAGASLTLDAPGLATLRLPLGGRDGRRALVRVWNDRCEAVEQGDDAAEWISRHLGRPLRIVHLPDSTLRPIEPNRAGVTGRVSFADAYPLLLIAAESLAGLNARLARPLPMNRFRPNLVTAGSAPHAEDEWRTLRMDGIEFTVTKPCARCVLTTVDQDTGIRGEEPLRTLATYRKIGRKVLFGQNVAHRGAGRLTVGCAVEVVA
jgi:hypothetical protein